MKIVPLVPALGAEVHDVDLRDELSPSEIRGMLDAFTRHHLLFLRGQDIDAAQQTRFAQHFGPISRSSPYMKSADQVYFIANARDDYPTGFGNGELLFHSDHTYVDPPDVKAILLYGLELPSSGGETLFVNAQKTYYDLPEELQTRISGLHALHGIGLTDPRGDKRFRKAESDSNTETAVQPLVRLHPETGKKILYVNEWFVDRIVDLELDEGEALLSTLFSHLYSKERQYEHTWEVGDVLIWDNHALQHARKDFDPKERRTLRKSIVAEPSVVKC